MSQTPESIDDFSQQELANLKELAQDVEDVAQETGVSRRDVLKAAGLLGAGSLAGGISAQQAIERFVQTAEADASTSDSDGNVGTPSDRVDVFADGLDSNSVSTEQIINGPIYAGNKDGSDPDARLDNALAEASNRGGREIIVLESDVSYDANRELSDFNTILGKSQYVTGTAVNATWTINNQMSIENVRTNNGEIVVEDGNTQLHKIQQANITVNSDEVLITNVIGGSVTFNSGTSGGLVDSSVGGVSVTDNGTNTIGDIA